MNIGQRIRQMREAAGYRSGADFSRKVGINPKTLWRYETDRSVPGLVIAIRIETIHTRMVVRSPAFVASRIRVTKSHTRLPVATQRSETGSIAAPRFSRWVEQQTGKRAVRRKTIQLASRRGSIKRRVVSAARLKPGNDIPTPERFKGRTSQAQVIAMLYDLDRGGHRNPFIVRGHPKIRSGLYRFGRKKKEHRVLIMLQDFDPRRAQPRKAPWMTIARSTLFRRFDEKRTWGEKLRHLLM